MQTTSMTPQNAQQTTNEQHQQVLTFTLSSELYGLDILRVQEIKGWEIATPIPNVPSYVKGVINLRGIVVPIVDLRERFHLGQPTYDNTTVVIIVRTLMGLKGEKIIGMVVDSVSDVFTVDLTSLQPAPKANISAVDQEFIRGLATLDGQMMILMDVDHLVQEGLFHSMSTQTQ
jgi:purine-binding chemotaxis protein CheW